MMQKYYTKNYNQETKRGKELIIAKPLPKKKPRTPIKENKRKTQWNCRGFSNKKEAVSDIISIIKPEVICQHETMLSEETKFMVSNYNGILKKRPSQPQISRRYGILPT